MSVVDTDGAHTVKLIEAIQRHRILYDSSHAFSKDILRKNKVWRDIALETGLENARTAKLKWRNLKNNYQKHKKSIENTNDLTYKKYKNWPWADQMDFLDGHTLNRNTSDSIFEQLSNIYNMNNQSEPRQSTKVPDENIPAPAPVPKKRKAIAATNTQANKTIQQVENKKKEEPSLDYVDHLFLYYSNICKNMPPRTQIEIKLRMAQMFAEAETNELSKEDPHNITYDQVQTIPDWEGQAFKEESDGGNDTS